MTLILDNSDVKTTFASTWNSVYVPAIIQYPRNSRQLLSILSQMYDTGTAYPGCIFVHAFKVHV